MPNPPQVSTDVKPLPPDDRILRPDELGQYLARKDWKEALFILAGKDSAGRPGPIARYMGGKIVLFPYEYHPDLKPGELWECQIIEDSPMYMRAVPIRRITQYKFDDSSLPPMPPFLAKLVVEKMTEEKAKLDPLLDGLEKRHADLLVQADKARRELKETEVALTETHEQMNVIRLDLSLIDRALKHFEKQCESAEIPKEHMTT